MGLISVFGYFRHTVRALTLALAAMLFTSGQAHNALGHNGAPVANAPPRSGVMPITLWAGKSGRGLYEVTLLRTILERTARDYPEYQLTVNSEHLGAQRGRQIVAEGILANVYVSGLRHDHYTRDKDIIVINRPVMRGLLGYRAAVIRAGDVNRYAQSASLHSLRNLVIGQGNSWEDAAILRHNGFTVNDSGRYENLLEMLAYHRFDAVFLGIAEVQQELAASSLREQLSIAYRPIIYYPQAMVFQVSGKHPELAKRIQEGFAKIVADGTHSLLLEQYFGAAIKRIREQHSDILILKHPRPELLPDLVQPQLLQAL